MFQSIFKAFAAAAVAGATLAAGQNASQAAVDTSLATVFLEFEATRLIPNLLPASDFALKAVLNQTFGNTAVAPGQLVSVSQVANVPRWTLEYASPQNFTNTSFTIITVDPSAASDQPRNIVRHYLANNVTLNGRNNELQNTTEPIAGWFSPAPPAGTGVHRYATLVFAEPQGFTAPANVSQRNTTIDTDFDLQSYVSQANLGSVVAATFFLAQNEDTTASTTATGIVSTSSVPAASISSAASSFSQSLATASQTPSGGSDSSSSSSGNGAAPATGGATFGILALTAVGAAAGAFLL